MQTFKHRVEEFPLRLLGDFATGLATLELTVEYQPDYVGVTRVGIVYERGKDERVVRAEPEEERRLIVRLEADEAVMTSLDEKARDHEDGDAAEAADRCCDDLMEARGA